MHFPFYQRAGDGLWRNELFSITAADFTFSRQKNGVPEWIRTIDLLLRRQSLYPAELRERIMSEYKITP